jgi:hypothetical protein
LFARLAVVGAKDGAAGHIGERELPGL